MTNGVSSSPLRLPEKPEVRRYPWRARRLGRLIVTTCKQAGRAPLVDDAWTHDREGNVYASRAILLTPWRRTRLGERPPMRALVLGWRR